MRQPVYWGVALGCVLGCTSVPRPREASPLVVLLPVGGDVWTEGKSYTIRWRTADVARVNVGFALGGKDKGHAALDLPASMDSLRWRVPAGFVSGFGLRRADNVRVRVEDAVDPTRFAESPSFSIVAAGD